MILKPKIDIVEAKFIEIWIVSVAKASFNDEYYIENHKIDLRELSRDELTWFNPFYGRSNHNTIKIAITECTDDEFVILQENAGKITEERCSYPHRCIVSENHSEYAILAAHISMCK